jgi:serine protease Do
MDEEFKQKTAREKKIFKNKNKSIGATIVFINFLVGLFGGVFGAYAYLDYQTERNPSMTKTAKMTVQENSAAIDAVKKAGPAVVSITGESKTLDFFGNVGSSKSAGTGFIVTKNGLILTNKHVVSDQSATYSVFTSQGKQYKAQIKATDPLNDIAFLKINADNLPVAELGNSDDLQIGQKVIAIGNALGQYQNTVTEGVVSAIGRAVQAGDNSSGGIESLENVIQTDAAINLGNSGGPLINLAGQVIGVNTAVDQQGQSISFAIPINVAKSAIDSVITKGKVIRPVIGLSYIPITKEFAASNNLPVNEGAYVYGSRNQLAVIPGSPADKAGLQDGDIVTKIDNNKISSTQSLSSIISKYKVGDRVKLTYIRDGKERIATITLVESKS